MEKVNLVEEMLQSRENNYPIPLQNIIVDDLNKTKNQTLHVKLIPIHELETFCYTVNTFYKPISKIIK